MLKRFVLRRFLKTKYLRFINLIGLTLVFTSVFISFYYIEMEESYDHFYANSSSIARFTVSYGGEKADGRIWNDKRYEPILKECPEIRNVLKMSQIQTTVLTHKDTKVVVDNILAVGSNFLSFFDLVLSDNNLEQALDVTDKVIVSEKMALQIFGKKDVKGERIDITGRKLALKNCIISGVFKDIPQNSHFHSDVIVCRDDFSNLKPYYYLLLDSNTDVKSLSEKINLLIQNDSSLSDKNETKAYLMPLTDIHLHSRLLRELDINGNIYFIYLIKAANVLLLVIVLFNLWLNSSLIFSYNTPFYHLLWLNGASFADLIKDEFRISFLISLIPLLISRYLALFIINTYNIPIHSISLVREGLLICILLFAATLVSLLPLFKSIVRKIVYREPTDTRNIRFSYSNVKYMLVIQYAIVIFIVITAICINNQLYMIKETQIGVSNDSILVMKEQPLEVIANYSLLKQRLADYPEFDMVTAAMQLPGDAIRDATPLRNEKSDQIYTCPILVVGEDFFPFFSITPIAGTLPPPLVLSAEEEQRLLQDKLSNESHSTHVRDQYIINRKALKVLGYHTAEEAIGKELTIEHSSLNYIPSGTICGVVDDFVYTNVYEEVAPLLIIQRNIHTSCFMFRFTPQHSEKALYILNEVWKEVNPEYPLHYSFLKDLYSKIYYNELGVEKMINIFSILCLSVTILGLFVFMSFMIKTRAKEVGIRKVNGASGFQIAILINSMLIIWIVVAFAIATPLSWFAMTLWMQNFAYKTELHWTIFASTGIFVILLSLIAVSWFSWKASKINPIDVLNSK